MDPTFQLSRSDDAPEGDERLSAGRLVLRALDPSGPDDAFVTRRAAHAVGSLPDGPERRYLGHVLRTAFSLEADADEQTRSLAAWAGHLESRGLLGWSSRVLERARALHPDHAELTLHAARVARKAGDRARAGVLYGQVKRADRGTGRLARMAEVGHALLADHPEPALGRAVRASLRAGDREAAAVALEARAERRRARGEVDGALRDYLAASVRYGHPADLGRIGHEVADMFLAAGDPCAARRALLETEGRAHPAQAERARARLLGLSRTVGDEVGMRRWADAGVPALVSLGLGRARPSCGTSGAGRLERAVTRLERVAR